MPQRLRAVVESELGLKILLGFVGVLFFLLGWTINPVDKDADVIKQTKLSGLQV
jgi:hypothetical protein